MQAMWVTKVTLVLLVLLGLSTRSEATKLTLCQKSYFMLRQCASELIGNRITADQCCELMAAFDVRDCVHRDPRLQVFAIKTVRPVQALRMTCAKNAPHLIEQARAMIAANNAAANDEALESAAKRVSKARRGDSTMMDDVASIAEAVLASGTGPTAVNVDITIEGKAEAVKSAVGKAISTAEGAAKNRGVILQSFSVVTNNNQTNGMCACSHVEMGESANEAAKSSMKYRYQSARLKLCKFVCSHRNLVVGALVAQMVAVGVWIMCLLVRPSWYTGLPKASSLSKKNSMPSSDSVQFIVQASDPEWLRPLLGDEEEGMYFGQH